MTAREFPFDAMIGVSRIADDQIVAEAGSIQDDPHGRLFMELARQIEFHSPFLQLAIDEVIAKYALTAESLVDFLFESPLFDADRKNLVFERRLGILGRRSSEGDPRPGSADRER